jgi:DNA ligase (NAD+)
MNFSEKGKINAKGWGEKKVEKLYYAGFDTLKKLLEADKASFMAAKIQGMGEKTFENLIQSRDQALANAGVAEIMAGTVIFDEGIGVRMIQKVIDQYPNFLDVIPTYEQIISIEGFADKKARKFIEGLPKFKNFIASIPILQQTIQNQLNKTYQTPKALIGQSEKQQEKQSPGKSFKGVTLVFTGFRDDELEKRIKALGGEVKSGVTKKVNYLVLGGPKGQGSSKEKESH